MKRAILICPDVRVGFEEILNGVPLALAMYLGKPIVDHALDGLARDGITSVLLLVSDRPSEVRAYVGSGNAWGLDLLVISEASELSVEAATARHLEYQADLVITLDQLPHSKQTLILSDVASWHASRSVLLPLLARHQVGAREIFPGVWQGLKAKIHPTAKLHAPCWLGPNTIVHANAVVGPHGFVESDSVVESEAAVDNSTLAPRTYLGAMTFLKDSIACGSYIINWANGSSTRITDTFLLSHLAPPQRAFSNFFGRISAFFILILLLPLVIIALTRPKSMRRHIAVMPNEPGDAMRMVSYYEMPCLKGKLRRWPRLWSIFIGEFVWVGNPPLSPEEAQNLESEFDRLWLQVAPGLFTAPEEEGCALPWDDEARAHAAFFAAEFNSKWRRKILVNGIKNFLV